MNQVKEPQSIAIIGTGTEVGKSYAACGLAKALLAAGQEVMALKPLESGVNLTQEFSEATSDEAYQLESKVSRFPRLQDGAPTDAQKLAQAATVGARSLYELPDPVSPHLAAERVGIEVSLSKTKDWIEQLKALKPRMHLILETAGGALSPLTRDADNLDLLKVVAPKKIVLIAPNRLGVLHDVAATLSAMSSRSLKVDHILLSDTSYEVDCDASTSTNLREIKRVVIPRFAALETSIDALAHEGSLDFMASRLLNGPREN